jgi:hypothetical protein
MALALGSYTTATTGLIRLDQRHVAEIGSLVNQVWHEAYGSSPHPRFSREYLEWLYGGPDASLNLLLGRRIDGRLIAFKALVARRVLLHGQRLLAHLATHLSIDPGLPLSERIQTGSMLMLSQTFMHDESLALAEQPDLAFGFFEGGKTLIHSTARALASYGLVRSTVTFQQSIVSPPAFRAASENAAAASLDVRPATRADVPAIGALLGRLSASLPLTIAMTPAALEHHLFNLPQGQAHVAVDSGTPAGAILFYPMEAEKLDQISRVVVVEYLLADTAEAALPLLREAVEFARASNARGVVVENATYLDPDLRRACGIVGSTRRMLLSTVAHSPVPLEDRFMLDVK